MTRIYKTARGKSIDIDKIKLANESAVSVGNMRVNARGDLLGPGNTIAAGRNQLMDQVYAIPDPGYDPNSTEEIMARQELIESQKARQLAELTNNLVTPAETVTAEKPSAPAARGTLASSLAKNTTVTQEPLPDLRKPKGPARI